MKTPKQICTKGFPHNDLYIAKLFNNLSTKDVLIKVLPYTTIPKDDNTILSETQSIVVSIVFTCHPQFHISFRYLDVGDTSCLDLACYDFDYLNLLVEEDMESFNGSCPFE
jgi:hypothetical protein